MILARIQGHPARAHLHQPLADSLGLPSEVCLHSSDPPDPFAGYRACLTEIPDGCKHLLVIQDDAVVCRNFAGAVDSISYSNPDTPVCLYLGGFPQGSASKFRRALIHKKPYITLLRSPIVPLVAVLWPVQKAREFLEWTNTARRMTRADDGNAGKWRNDTNQEIRVAVPCLVDHPDMEPSVKGGRKSSQGKDPLRRALHVSEDGLKHNW